MFIDLPGIVGNRSSGGGGFPPYGTWLSSVCSGPNAHDQGPGDYYDVNNTQFTGMFTLWEQFADGAGGSYWSSAGNNSSDGKDPPTSCWLPQYFYYSNGSDQVGFYWEACGQNGTFYYGSTSYYGFYNGDGTTTSGGGFSSYGYQSGYTIYDGGCCQVFFDGTSGYYVSDNCGGGGGGCPDNGTSLGSGCISTSGYDASGQYWSGTWTYVDFYADGNCGQYYNVITDNSTGCFFPYGYWMSYNGYGPYSLTWTVYDSCSNQIAQGSYTYGSSWDGWMADGNGGSFYSSGSSFSSYGDLIASGSYQDCDWNYYNYNVRYDGMGGFYVELY